MQRISRRWFSSRSTTSSIEGRRDRTFRCPINKLEYLPRVCWGSSLVVLFAVTSEGVAFRVSLDSGWVCADVVAVYRLGVVNVLGRFSVLIRSRYAHTGRLLVITFICFSVATGSSFFSSFTEYVINARHIFLVSLRHLRKRTRLERKFERRFGRGKYDRFQKFTKLFKLLSY